VAHLGLPASLRDHVQMKYYDAGHMMYLHPPSLRQMKAIWRRSSMPPVAVPRPEQRYAASRSSQRS